MGQIHILDLLYILELEIGEELLDVIDEAEHPSSPEWECCGLAHHLSQYLSGHKKTLLSRPTETVRGTDLTSSIARPTGGPLFGQACRTVPRFSRKTVAATHYGWPS